MNKRDYYEKNKDMISKKAKECYKNNRDALLNKTKEYYENNREIIRECAKNKYVSLTEEENIYHGSIFLRILCVIKTKSFYY